MGIKLNLIDKAINAIDPVKGSQRLAARFALEQQQKFLNSGYDQGGASGTKSWAKDFIAESNSPQEDLDYNLKTLRDRARTLEMTSPLASAAVNTTATKTVGSGLYLKTCIDHEFLGVSREEAEQWARSTEREFALWAESKHCDATGVHTFYEMQELALRGMLSNGDGLAITKYAKATPYMPYELRIQVIESDRLTTPLYSAQNTEKTLNYTVVEGFNKDNNNRIINGIEIDNNGKVVAYWICNRYPNEYMRLRQDERKWVRIEAYGKQTGNPNVLHLFQATRAGSYRGVPMLSPVIESLKQLQRYSDAEIMAAVISGMFTVFVKSNGASSNNPLSGMANPFAMNQPLMTGDGDNGEAPVHKRSNVEDLAIGNGAITILEDGEDVSIANPARPNANYDGFITSVYKQIGAGLEIPYEVLLKSFNSSYSASRAALLDAAEVFKKRRVYLQDGFCQPIYEMWLAEAVAKGRIKAKGFFSDPLIRKAWCGAKWNSTATVPVLDPTKEVEAAARRVQEGFSTREQETVGLTGGDFKTNAEQLYLENELITRANAVLAKKDTPPSDPKAEEAMREIESMKEERNAEKQNNK